MSYESYNFHNEMNCVCPKHRFPFNIDSSRMLKLRCGLTSFQYPLNKCNKKGHLFNSTLNDYADVLLCVCSVAAGGLPAFYVNAFFGQSSSNYHQLKRLTKTPLLSTGKLPFIFHSKRHSSKVGTTVLLDLLQIIFLILFTV